MRIGAVEYGRLLETLLAEGRTVTARLHGSSMFPSIVNGTVVHLRPVGGRPLRKGDVALLRYGNGAVVCHRVWALKRSGGKLWVRTWGDGRPAPDRAVPIENAIGIVTGMGDDQAPVPPGPPRWQLACRYVKHCVLRCLQAVPEAAGDTECHVVSD
jgi:hypothetical protein